MRLTKKIDLLLLSLLTLDCILAIAAYAFPQFWFTVFHGTDYTDPQALLQRAGGAWLAFAVLQIIALKKWRTQPEWLLIAAGVRLADMFTDWSYLAFAHDKTPFAWLSLIAASPSNLAMGLFLIHAFRAQFEIRQKA